MGIHVWQKKEKFRFARNKKWKGFMIFLKIFYHYGERGAGISEGP